MLSITSYLMFVSLKIANMAISIRAIQFLTGGKKVEGDVQMKLTNKNHFDKYIVFSQKLNLTSCKKTDTFIRNDIC